jgi:hypothetical protein
MNAKRLFLTALTVLVVVVAAGAAWSFVIEDEEALDRVSQIVNLKGVSTTGELNFSSILRVMPNGTEVPFAIPSGWVLLITRFYFDLKTTSTEPFANVRLEPFLYAAANGSRIVNGNTSGVMAFASGCPVGPRSSGSPSYLIRAVVPGVGTTVTGTLNVYMTGFLLNPEATVAPIINLLMLE